MADQDILNEIERLFPYDGPHSAETVATAAQAVNRLVRYLNNATGPWNAPHTLEWGATIYRVVGALSGSVDGMEQLFDQLRIAAEAQATDPTAYDDRRDRPAATTAHELAATINDARGRLGEVAAELDRAHSLAGHLGND